MQNLASWIKIKVKSKENKDSDFCQKPAVRRGEDVIYSTEWRVASGDSREDFRQVAFGGGQFFLN